MRYALAFVTVSSVVGGCAFAEISLPQSSSRPAPSTDRVGSRVVVVRTKDGFAPLGCYDATSRTIAGGDACAALVPDGATLQCVGGGSISVDARTTVPCEGDGTWTALVSPSQVPCSVATWTSAGRAPEIVVVPREAPKATADEQRVVDVETHQAIEQSITLDVDGDGAKDRLFATDGAVVLAYATAPEKPFVIHRDLAQPRLQGVTDLDGDGRPELWLATRGPSWTLERIFGGTATPIGRAGCPPPVSP